MGSNRYRLTPDARGSVPEMVLVRENRTNQQSPTLTTTSFRLRPEPFFPEIACYPGRASFSGLALGYAAHVRPRVRYRAMGNRLPGFPAN